VPAGLAAGRASGSGYGVALPKTTPGGGGGLKEQAKYRRSGRDIFGIALISCGFKKLPEPKLKKETDKAP
jgi:hypothetical protein